jgi:hypothetical protein
MEIRIISTEHESDRHGRTHTKASVHAQVRQPDVLTSLTSPRQRMPAKSSVLCNYGRYHRRAWNIESSWSARGSARGNAPGSSSIHDIHDLASFRLFSPLLTP